MTEPVEAPHDGPVPTRSSRRLSPLTPVVRAPIVMLAVLGGVAVWIATPASASASQCPSTRFCIFDGTGYTGSMYGWGNAWQPGCVVQLWRYGWNDRAESVVNNTGKTVYWYEDDWLQGTSHPIPPHTRYSSISPRNKMSSWTYTSSCSG